MKKQFLSIAGIVLLISFFLFGRWAWQNYYGKPLPKLDLPAEAIVEEKPILLDNIYEGSIVGSPLIISGKARGTWFFEASFPVEVRDANNQLLGQSHAQAQGEWMTEGFVLFKSNITFNKSATETGWLIFKKDNPSGLPENDAEYKLKIEF